MSELNKFLVFVLSVCLLGIGLTLTEPTDSQLSLEFDNKSQPLVEEGQELLSKGNSSRSDEWVSLTIIIQTGEWAGPVDSGLFKWEVWSPNEGTLCGASKPVAAFCFPIYCGVRKMRSSDSIMFTLLDEESTILGLAEFQAWELVGARFQRVQLRSSSNKLVYTMFVEDKKMF